MCVSVQHPNYWVPRWFSLVMPRPWIWFPPETLSICDSRNVFLILCVINHDGKKKVRIFKKFSKMKVTKWRKNKFVVHYISNILNFLAPLLSSPLSLFLSPLGRIYNGLVWSLGIVFAPRTSHIIKPNLTSSFLSPIIIFLVFHYYGMSRSHPRSVNFLKKKKLYSANTNCGFGFNKNPCHE